MSRDYHILVVDDNYGIRRFLKEFLTQEGFYVTEASDGMSALKLAIEEKPSLILLDMRMPGISGMQTIAKLRDLVPKTIVVAMSAYVNARDIREALQEGLIQHFIMKPFDLVEIRVLLNDLLNNLFRIQS
ncbi:response regulator [Desulfosporosinus sp. Sb-LF]|uniref:response regulator n=1 Tax=Desulfosporosinus sp. Sb-LF TaxID=2560027 RepID=UPI001FB14817|nr:response regulator [Desulfosporosinus sp. Sb-LF]